MCLLYVLLHGITFGFNDFLFAKRNGKKKQNEFSIELCLFSWIELVKNLFECTNRTRLINVTTAWMTFSFSLIFDFSFPYCGFFFSLHHANVMWKLLITENHWINFQQKRCFLSSNFIKRNSQSNYNEFAHWIFRGIFFFS